MLIQPVQPVNVTIKIGKNMYECQMISLSETELVLNCNDYLEKDTQALFIARYFRGVATIREIEFIKFYFTYKLEIENIQFQPGLLINTRL
ncbi:hypothetical protein [Legionella bononiensis]|uniref:Uncharacterized protein n=1 Tax=Legionella bononiensis TaxID=2793102 RepID=A0ABS1WFU8_9GAMM|nr:hypothetical protein [Legionella bononiensis]MBL7481691.1 hypothetical protein [Legionella bononiensis]MBL7528239.1 hypothetical protein [Legionella bononiensis]MBL7562714.1 hypothetical protein [Legionella bononiensis]